MENLEELCESHPEVELSSKCQPQCTPAKRSGNSVSGSNVGSTSGPVPKRKKGPEYITKNLQHKVKDRIDSFLVA